MSSTNDQVIDLTNDGYVFSDEYFGGVGITYFMYP